VQATILCAVVVKHQAQKKAAEGLRTDLSVCAMAFWDHSQIFLGLAISLSASLFIELWCGSL